MSGLLIPEALAGSLRASDHRIIVTGAGGWIGSATLDMLHRALGPERFGKRVLACAGSARSLTLRDGTEVPLAALDQISSLPAGPCVVFHYAFLGREKVAELSLEAYRAANGRITDTMRRAIERLRPAGMFLASSGAVYRPDRTIDTDLAANPYGVLKHRDEVAFAEACGAVGTKLVTARVFNLAGEYINKVASYALSSFILDAQAGRAITIRARKRVERSYVYVGDVITLALACLLNGKPAPSVFDTVGERVVEVGELANLIRTECGQPDLPISRPLVDSTQPPDRYVGDVAGMRAALEANQISLKTLPQQIELTAGDLAKMR